jgi:phospholipid/cholesterol/gamma-HCH transport system substrate-binding protein
VNARNIRVGLFVLGGMLFSALVIFLIGDERRLFERSVEFTARFSDVQGLKASAPIRMGGVDIGHVSSVAYDLKKGGDGKIIVTLSIVTAEATRIKSDSLVRVAAKGLLGDKMIEITRGKPESPGVEPGAQLVSEEPKDLMGKVDSISDRAEGTMAEVQEVAHKLNDEKLHRDLRESVASVNAILKDVSNTLENLDRTSAELAVTLAEVRQVAARVRTGPGFTHDVIYGDGPQKEIAAFGFAANEVGLSLKGIRESESLTHDALYGGKGSGAKALDNVAAITDDLRAITAGMRQGKGTLGALLVDPSVYEDMKLVLGNVERNDVLRALVRYSIKQDEKKPEVKVGAQR